MIKLYYLRNTALLVGNSYDAETHSHHLIEIFTAVENHTKIQIDGQYQEAKNLIIDSDVPHLVTNNDNLYAVLLVDPESEEGIHLRKNHLRGRAFRILSDSFDTADEKITALSNDGSSISDAAALKNLILKQLQYAASDENHLDPRIKKTVEFINQLPENKASIGELAGRVYMSESRLIHLFTRQIGIPMRRYMLWARLLTAARLIMDGSSFTEAAHKAGFSDSSHLSRTFKAMFGLSLQQLFKNRKDDHFIQVITG